MIQYWDDSQGSGGARIRNLRALLTALVFGTAAATGANAQTIPDMKGTWVYADVQSIVAGTTPHRPVASPHPATSGQYTLGAPTTFTLRIEGQEGRRFWGSLASEQASERLIGSFSVDGRNVFMVADNGFYDGVVVDADTIEYCYRHITAEGRLVACGLLERQK